MSRKEHYLQIKEQDRETYNLLLNCRHVTQEQLRTYSSTNRINSYLKEKLIEKVDIADLRIYRLTNKGYREFEKVLGRENCRYHSNSILHDIKLAEKYIQVHERNEAVRWRNEEDLKREKNQLLEQLREERDFERIERLEKVSVPDCSYSSGDFDICYEVITDNYSNIDIQAKIDYCREFHTSITFDKIR